MGWRGSKRVDVVMLALLDGPPATVQELVQRIDARHWQRTGERPGTANYQSVYQRLCSMELAARVVRAREDGSAPRPNAWRWRPASEEDIAEATAARREELGPDEKARKLATQVGERLGAEVELVFTALSPIAHKCERAIVIVTPRGRIEQRVAYWQTWLHGFEALYQVLDG